MVQLKYFGDDRDYFKYDLITQVLDSVGYESYGFIPMLTEHRDDNEGNKRPNTVPCKSIELLEFIGDCDSHDLAHWCRWIAPYVNSYLTVEPVNGTLLHSDKRGAYWQQYSHIIQAKNALIFFDPDTGLQAGRKTRIKLIDYEKYILNDELPILFSSMDESSTFMIYQHLQQNSKKHEEDIERKVLAIRGLCPESSTQVYREKDLAFIFLSKKEENFLRVSASLKQYYDRSTITTKWLYV